MRINALAALAATIFLAPGFALATPDPARGDPPRITVKTSDLDLSAPAGRDVLARRVRRAAADLCGPDAGELDRLQAHLRVADCVKQASDAALKSVEQQPARPNPAH